MVKASSAPASLFLASSTSAMARVSVLSISGSQDFRVFGFQIPQSSIAPKMTSFIFVRCYTFR